jgi:hypothetical protein
MNIERRQGDIAELSNDLNVITAEIKTYQRVAGEAIFEIGRRLKHVKENDLAHGEFGKWLESVGIEGSQARRFMKVVEELDVNRGTYHDLGLRALYEIATLPPDQREKPHTIPSTGEVKTVDEMTVRELREVKKALKQAQQEKELAERRAEHAEEIARKLESREIRTEYVEVKDELTERKLKRYEELFGDISMYEGRTTRVTNGDAITYAVFEFSEDVRKFIEKYSHLTHFAREFNDMIDEGKEEYRRAIYALNQFTSSIERRLNEKDAIILEG